MIPPRNRRDVAMITALMISLNRISPDEQHLQTSPFGGEGGNEGGREGKSTSAFRGGGSLQCLSEANGSNG